MVGDAEASPSSAQRWYHQEIRIFILRAFPTLARFTVTVHSRLWDCSRHSCWSPVTHHRCHICKNHRCIPSERGRSPKEDISITRSRLVDPISCLEISDNSSLCVLCGDMGMGVLLGNCRCPNFQRTKDSDGQQGFGPRSNFL